MKIWKILKSSMGVVAYVKVPDSCDISDTGYAALQLVRGHTNDRNVSGTQLLDCEEKILEGIPIYIL